MAFLLPKWCLARALRGKEAAYHHSHIHCCDGAGSSGCLSAFPCCVGAVGFDGRVNSVCPDCRPVVLSCFILEGNICCHWLGCHEFSCQSRRCVLLKTLLLTTYASILQLLTSNSLSFAMALQRPLCSCFFVFLLFFWCAPIIPFHL